MSVKITPVGDRTTALGECPRWDGQQFWLMDCRAGQILTLTDDGRLQVQAEVPPPAGSFALCSDGGLLVALRHSLLRIHPDGRREESAALPQIHENLRLNDGTVLPDGSYLVGTMHILRAEGEPPLGGLFRLEANLGLTRLAEPLGVANGPLVHPQDGRVYVADSAARVIWSYAFDARRPAAGLTDRRLFADLGALGSAPDGCCLDAEGGLWTALVHAGALVRFDREGQVTQRIDLPLRHPTALCFGGPKLDRICVTSISDSGRLRADGPLDGRVLLIDGHGHHGLPMPSFKV